MTTEELLNPRYKVIAAYPSCPFQVGTILNPVDVKTLCGDFPQFLGYYPHLFKKVDWWEERTFEQLCDVEYIQFISRTPALRLGDIVPVVEFTYNKNPWYLLKTGDFVSIINVIPSTQEQYNKQNKKI
jgi:hypothetical protein